MRTTVCDVCSKQEEGHPEWIEASIPATMLGELGQRLQVDICSMDCLGVISGSTPDAEEEPQEPTPQERQISVPQQSNPRFIPLSQQESEDATGVRRKY